jgi:5'-3' exonuclease
MVSFCCWLTVSVKCSQNSGIPGIQDSTAFQLAQEYFFSKKISKFWLSEATLRSPAKKSSIYEIKDRSEELFPVNCQ